MRLLGFKYLEWQRILTLTVILTVSAMLFSITAFSLLGFYRGFTSYLSEGEDIVAIYDTNSRTPFTGMVPAYLAERIGAVNGVLASSPEVMVPCIVKSEAIFLRGVVPGNFTKLNPLTIIEGGMLELGDLNSIIVGKNAAEKLGLKLNEEILVLGVLTDQYMELRVKGIYESHSVMDDEALVPLHVGQWLRGTDYNHVTLIRFKIDRSLLRPSAIFEEVSKEASGSTPSSSQEGAPSWAPIIPTTATKFAIKDIGVEEAQNLMSSYLEKYGLTKEALVVLSIVVFILSSVSAVLASETIITQHRTEIDVLRSIGASKKAIKRDVLVKLLPWSLISSLAGTAAAAAAMMVIQENGYLQVLSHTVPFQLDHLVIAVGLVIPFLLVFLSILRFDLE